MYSESSSENLRPYEVKAAEYVADKKKASSLLNPTIKKLLKNPSALKNIVGKLELLISLLKDWISGDYKDISKKSLIMLMAGLLYFITPPDMVPDFIPLAGFLDDATVIGFVANRLAKDIDQYKVWKESRENARITRN